MEWTLEDLRTQAGRILYAELPEEYRYRDAADESRLGDLEAFLHAFGHLLDLVRGTTEQLWADAFPEPLALGRSMQPWVLPYLGQLLGAELVAPAPESRRQELGRTVAWSKSKGSLLNVDSVADTIAGTNVLAVEGWTRLAVTPRIDLPPFSTPPASRSASSRFTGLPQRGTPDVRLLSRAVVDDDGSSPVHALVFTGLRPGGVESGSRTLFWKPFNPLGTPCFAGAYDDVSARTPDLRDASYGREGPHPSIVDLHLPPPHGLFEPNLLEVDLGSDPNPLGFDLDEAKVQRFGPAEVLSALGQGDAPVPRKLRVKGALFVHPGLHVVLHDLVFEDGVRVPAVGELLDPQDPEGAGPNDATRLRLERCAVGGLNVGKATGDEPTVEAWDCLFWKIHSETGFAKLVYCTVLSSTRIDRLWASDCIFAGPLEGVKCEEAESCVRYSRVPDLTVLAGCGGEKGSSNTDALPRFARRYHESADGRCELRPSAYGEPGAGVLDLSCSVRLREGAEDEGEMGVGHHLFLCASVSALGRKLDDTLPMGQSAEVSYDPLLLVEPPRTE